MSQGHEFSIWIAIPISIWILFPNAGLEWQGKRQEKPAGNHSVRKAGAMTAREARHAG